MREWNLSGVENTLRAFQGKQATCIGDSRIVSPSEADEWLHARGLTLESRTWWVDADAKSDFAAVIPDQDQSIHIVFGENIVYYAPLTEILTGCPKQELRLAADANVAMLAGAPEVILAQLRGQFVSYASYSISRDVAVRLLEVITDRLLAEVAFVVSSAAPSGEAADAAVKLVAGTMLQCDWLAPVLEDGFLFGVPREAAMPVVVTTRKLTD
jgi:hypothetical protein